MEFSSKLRWKKMVEVVVRSGVQVGECEGGVRAWVFVCVCAHVSVCVCVRACACVCLCWNGLNCQNWWLDISQQTIRKLHDFLGEEMQGVALMNCQRKRQGKTPVELYSCIAEMYDSIGHKWMHAYVWKCDLIYKVKYIQFLICKLAWRNTTLMHALLPHTLPLVPHSSPPPLPSFSNEVY